MNSNANNKNHTRPKQVHTQAIDKQAKEPKVSQSSTTVLSTRAAKDTLELAVVSLPTSLQPLLNHFGIKIITACCKRNTKGSISQQMDQDKNYVLHSAKSSDFKLTLSHGAKENNERVSFLEQQVQQAKSAYETSLKTIIEECMLLEIQAATIEETEIIMDLLPAIG